MLTAAAGPGAGSSTRPAGRAGAAALALLLLVVGLAGCGGATKKPSTGATRTTTSTATRTATPTPPKPIATFDETTDAQGAPIPFQVSIYDLRRDGPFLVLDFGIRCLSPANPGCGVLDAFAEGNVPESEYGTDLDGVPTGVDLVDPANLKAYLPVRDSENRAYVSTLISGDTVIKDSLVHLEWVRYPAPATATSALDVAFPDGGPVVPNVPITNGPGPTAVGGRFVAATPNPFAQPPGSTNTAGLTLPAENLTLTSGNPIGNDSESPGKAQLTLQSDVLFQFDKSSLTPRARTILRSVAEQIKTRAHGTVQVTGYTDSIGTNAVNIPLSQARAHSVVSALIPLTPGINYTSQGLGSADPVAPNTNSDGSDNPAGRALNRRVTIAFAATAQRPTPPAPATPAAGTGPQAGSITFRGPINNDDTYRVSGAALHRDGNLLVLSMTVSCLTLPSGNACDPTYDLAGWPSVPPAALNTNSSNGFDAPAQHSLSGFYLLDPTTGTEYIPVRDSAGAPITTTFGEELLKGAQYQVWSYFSAPPAATTALTLGSPGGGPRLGPIAISAAPPAVGG